MINLGRLLNPMNWFGAGFPHNSGPNAARLTDGDSIKSDNGWWNARTMTTGEGKPVINEHTALNMSAVWAANRVLSGAVSILPLKIYKTDQDDSRTQDRKSNAAKIAKKPNREMTSITFWEAMTTHMIMRGNAYAEIEFDSYKNPVALWPLHPGSCTPDRDTSGNIIYRSTGNDGKEVVLDASRIFHVPGMGCDGLKGYSVIEMARKSLGVGASYEQAASSLADNGMRPSGALKFPGSLQELAKDDKAKEINKKHGGVSNWGKMLLLYGGMEWQQFGINPADAQFLETRAFQVEEIARWFMIPPHMLYDLRRSTNNNIEHQGQQFVTFSLMYWLTKIAQEYDRKIIRDETGDTYSEHLVDALLRGDFESRMNGYGKAINWGIMSPNDARRKENQSPAPGGDQYFIPVNMRPIDEPFQPNAPRAPKNNNGGQTQ